MGGFRCRVKVALVLFVDHFVYVQHTIVLTIKSMNNEKTRSEWVWMTRKKHNHTLGTSRQFSL